MGLLAENIAAQVTPWGVAQATQLRASVAAARAASRLAPYRDAWSKVGLDEGGICPQTWPALPFLSKDMLIEAARVQPPFGGRLGVEQGEIAHIFVAPGPLYMPYTAQDLHHVASSFAKAFRSCGLAAGDLVDQTTMYNWVIAATVIDRALSMVGCGVVPGGVGQSERHIEVIRALGIDAIIGFPTFVEHILESAATDGLKLPLRKAVVMGELSHPETKQRMYDVFGVEAREFYGVADVGAVAWQCAHGQGMHLRDDLLVEFVTPGGTEAITPSPETPAELVVTDFHRQAMPVIRLRTGDLVDELITEPCRCGFQTPRLRRIVGRTGEITKVKGMFVVPRLVQDVFERQRYERRFQLVVDRLEGDRDSLTLTIAGDRPDDPDALRVKVEAALRLKLNLVFVESLPENAPRLVDLRLQERRP